VQWG